MQTYFEYFTEETGLWHRKMVGSNYKPVHQFSFRPCAWWMAQGNDSCPLCFSYGRQYRNICPWDRTRTGSPEISNANCRTSEQFQRIQEKIRTKYSRFYLTTEFHRVTRSLTEYLKTIILQYYLFQPVILGPCLNYLILVNKLTVSLSEYSVKLSG